MQIADALDKAHRSSVVHRELKPGNIMLTSARAKLLDFGLAKPTERLSVATLTAAARQSTPMTEQGVIVGIFQYMSPEQIEGKELDGRSDIFRLALCCTRCLPAGVRSKARANSALPRPSWKGNHIVIPLGLLAMLMFWGRGKSSQPQTEG